MSPYLQPGLSSPVPTSDGLDSPYWQGLHNEQLLLQRCVSCRRWQWGPEWVCHRCHSFDVAYEPVEPLGVIFSHQRVWHPVHPALADQGPYVVVLVELPQADNVRVVGNLLGDPEQPLQIGARVSGIFEHHNESDPNYTLLQWAVTV